MKLFELVNLNYEEGYSMYYRMTIVAESLEQARELANNDEETYWGLRKVIELDKPMIISVED